jgi:hypothetical protein
VSSEPETSKAKQPTLTTLWQRLGLSEIAALSVGFLYVSGYFINSIFVRNLGIADTELLRLEYIKIGFTFTLVTLGYAFLPVSAFYLTYKVRGSSKLPHLHIGAIGNSSNTALFLAFPLFLAFFITRYEWDLNLPSSVLGFTRFKTAAITAMILSAIGTIVVPYFERLINKTRERRRMSLYRFVVEPIRYGILIISLYLILRILSQIPWMGFLITSGFYYFLAGAVLVAGVTAAKLWIQHIRKIRGAWMVFVLISFGLAALYYLAITSYVFGVYTFIPANRGGRLPLTQAYLEITEHNNLFTGERVIGGTTLRGPVYIIEDHDDVMYVASERMDRWLYEFVPVHAIRKEKVPYVYMERIENGFPRITGP